MNKKKSLQKTEGKQLAKARRRAKFSNPYHQDHLIKTGLKQWDELKEDNSKLNSDDPIYKMLTLFEFEGAWLLIQGFNESYKAFVMNMSVQFQEEYHCQTASEKATAHLAAQNLGRTMEIQRDISIILNGETYNDLKLKKLSILEKAYDRACRQYAQSIHSLKTMKQPPLNVTVKAITANLAQQQIIQENNNVKPK